MNHTRDTSVLLLCLNNSEVMGSQCERTACPLWVTRSVSFRGFNSLSFSYSLPLSFSHSLSLPLCPRGRCNHVSPVRHMLTWVRAELWLLGSWQLHSCVALLHIRGQLQAQLSLSLCESHDSSAGNREQPVIQAAHRLHLTTDHIVSPSESIVFRLPYSLNQAVLHRDSTHTDWHMHALVPTHAHPTLLYLCNDAVVLLSVQICMLMSGHTILFC